MKNRGMEIIPPGHTLPAARPPVGPPAIVRAPEPPPGNFIDRFFHRLAVEHERDNLALYEDRAKSEAAFWEAQTTAFDKAVQCREAAFRLATRHEVLEFEHAHAAREAEHRLQVGELRRRKEMIQAQAELDEAEFSRQAQHDIGPALARQARDNSLLDLQLAAEQRRAVLRRYLQEVEGRQAIAPATGVDDALYEARAELQANGLDTSRLDALIEQRRRR